METLKIPALELGRRIREREIGCEEAVRATLASLVRQDKRLNAFITTMEEAAVSQARAVQKRLDAGEALSSLAGVPFAAKDNLCVRGVNATCASRMLEDFRPPYTASALEKLEQGGAILLGKLNMDEFSMGGSTETSFYGPVRNPWNTQCVPGGSSGGCAAAVASGEVFFAIGSDTGGSIRQPCAFCGVSGIRPTYGGISRFGLIAHASSMDQIGPIARDIRDCAEILAIIGGYDSRDATSVRRVAPDFSGAWSGDVRGLHIGLNETALRGADAQVAAAVSEAANRLKCMGAKLIPVDTPWEHGALAAYYVIACAEASSNLARYDGVRYGLYADGDTLRESIEVVRSQGFGAEVKRRILLGTHVLKADVRDAYYHRAMRARDAVRAELSNALSQCDVLLGPVAPTVAYRLGEYASDPIGMASGDAYTVSASLAGLPAASIPCGLSESGLPIGMQLVGRAFEEPLLIRVAHAYQLHTDFHLRRPPSYGGSADAL